MVRFMYQKKIPVRVTTRRLSNMKRYRIRRRRCVKKSMLRLVRWLLCIGLVVACVLSACPSALPIEEELNVPCKIEVLEVVLPELEPIQLSEPEPEPEALYEDLGTYRITAYCACEKCCGKWALNRPNGIVYGAEGTELVAGISCASPLPFGTILEIEDLGQYVVQDRIAQWVLDKYGDNCIDIYCANHEDISTIGMQYLNVKVVLS